jgi:hypothetical protein
MQTNVERDISSRKRRRKSTSANLAPSASEPYRPCPRTAEILSWCLKRVQAVPYRVTARWLFYRLVQERGFHKSEYKNYLKWMSSARKRFYDGWTPSSLADDTRTAHVRGHGYKSAAAWMDSFKLQRCVLDKYASQRNIVEIWFEAEAMYGQFNHYTRPYHVTLRPFKGDASIDYKWKIAKNLEALAAYGKPIVILYFGDFDPKGLEIPDNALRDIRAWCRAPFRFIRCGINQNQIQEFGLIEQPERPGCYQWEALSETDAQHLILGNLERFWSLGDIKKVETDEDRATCRWIQLIQNILTGEGDERD